MSCSVTASMQPTNSPPAWASESPVHCSSTGQASTDDANSPETDVWAEVCARRIWSPGDLCLGDVLCLSRLRRRGQLLGVESPRPAPAPGASFAVIGSGPCREDGIQANSNRNDTDSDLKQHIKVDQTEATWRRIILLYLCPASFPEQSP